jgi:hypothetical protein
MQNYKEWLDFAKKGWPRFFGCIPLVALFFGLLNAKNGISEAGSDELNNQASIVFVGFIFYWIFVLFRQKLANKLLDKLANKLPSLLFTTEFILFLNFLSSLIVSIFTLPLVTSDNTKGFVIFIMLFLQGLFSWFLLRKSISTEEKYTHVKCLFFP